MSNGHDKIIRTAIELFAQNTFDEVSVSQICKQAKVSNGLFYKYFKNKEEIFKHLLEETSKRIRNYFQNINGKTPEEKLIDFIEINFELTKKELSLVKVYREGQYKFIEFEQKLRIVYLEALKKIFNRDLNELEYIFVMSGIRFINVNYVVRGIENNSKFLAKTILNGLSDKSELNLDKLKDKDFYLRVPFNSDNLKNKLLERGEILFGTKGVYETKIYDITSDSSVGIGSFYYYFKNKEDFLVEIIMNTKNTLMYFLKDNYDENLSPIDNHLMFLYLMQEYFQKSIYKYKLLREVEFIKSYISLDFYISLENFYIETLKTYNLSIEEKRIISSILIGLSHYMGIEFFFTKNLNDKMEFLKSMKSFLLNGIRVE
jgi:AcrR family transcriptional regulator